MNRNKIELCFFSLLWMIAIIYGSPPTKTLELPLLEEQAIGSEVHNLMQDPSMDGRSGFSFKLLSQHMSLGNDVVDDVTKWVALNERTGVISVAKPVDREEYCNSDKTKKCVVHVKIVRQPRSDLLLIDIELNVIDINDHAPQFPVYPEITVNVSEAVPVTTWINLDKYLATDEDQGSNAEIYYSLSRSRRFSLHKHTDTTTGDPHLELVITDELDREDQSSYDLILTARDRGSPQQQSSSVTLRVLILDANDHSPVFDKQTYSIKLLENVSPGFEVTTVHATDADSNMFGELRYFVPQTRNSQIARDLIDVDPLTGEVFLKQPLDREKHNNLRVVIAARDLAPGGQEKVGNTIVEIQVTDINDNAPSIHISIIVETNESAAFVSESSEVGTYIARITADDTDYGKNGEVSVDISMQPILGSDSKEAHTLRNFFALEDESFIKTDTHFDRESLSQFLITIRACDAGTESLCSFRNLTVIILDENDNAPIFSSSGKSIVLQEDTDIGTIVSSVQATDRDSLHPPAVQLTEDKLFRDSLNGVIRYELHGNGNCFAIDEDSGEIRLVRPLDYESKKSWKITATAWDKGSPKNSANITINVDVIDINDNTPVFTSPSRQNQTIAATIQSDDVILQIIDRRLAARGKATIFFNLFLNYVQALDYDGKSFSQIQYHILSEDGSKKLPHKFILDETSGNLRLNMSNPNLESVVGSHTLLIQAQDSGSPPLSQILHLRVQVYDVPLSVLPSFTEEQDTMEKPEIDMTVVLIASLASAALLLVIILSLMLFRCKQNRMENRSYNCKNTETKTDHFRFGSNLTNNMPAMSSDRFMTSSQSSFTSHNWKNNSDIRFTSNPHELSSLMKLQPPSKRKGSCLKDSTFVSILPSALQVDKDSGRGDSDHDATSYDEKDSSHQADNISNRVPSTSQDAHEMNQTVDSFSRPRCTYLCEQYGHSDACWMPRNGQNLEAVVNQPSNVYHYVTYPGAEAYSGTICASSGLETISETQPLYSVLSAEQAYFDKEGMDYSCGDGSQVMLLNSANAVYHPSSGRRSASSVQLPHHYQYDENYQPKTSYQQHAEPEAAVANLQYSISDAFHDRYEIVEPPISASPLPSYHIRYHQRNSQSPSTIQNPSMHNHELPKRGSVSSRLPSIEEGQRTPSLTPRPGEVSMEETREIIENIDRLIDH